MGDLVSGSTQKQFSMKTFDIKGKKRDSLGKKATKALRVSELVPCVLYNEKENTHFAVEEKAFQYLIYTPNVYIINIDIDGKKSQAVMQDVQFHPVTDKILHADFLEINDKKKVNFSIPVKLNGLAKGVTQGGKLMLKLRKLKVNGFAKDFPDTLDINVSELELGKTIKVGDLEFPKLTLLDSKNAVITTVKLTRSAISANVAKAEETAEPTESK